jgi:hypothetical protein
MRRLLHLLLVVVAALAFLPGNASAQSEADKTTARALAEEGHAALDAKDYATAADRFKRAEKLYHAPTLLLGLARAYVGLGKFVEAKESYNLVIREKLGPDASDAFKQAVEDAQREIVGLDAKIGWVTIRVEGPEEPKVLIDDAEVSAASLGVKRAVNPGPHVVKASANGYDPGETNFNVEAGSSQDVTLKLVANPDAVVDGGAEDGGATLRLVGFIAIGVGGAGLIVGAVTGGLAMGKHSKLEDNCPGGQCPPDQQDNLDSFHTLGTVSTVGFIAGGVLAAAGIVLVVVGSLGGSSEEEGADSALLTTEIGPGHINAKLRF